MNKIMKHIIKFLGIVAFAAMVLACQPEPDAGGTKVQDMAGEWWVTYQVETSPGVFEDVAGGYYKMMTYNTASNSDTLWVDDLEHFWEYKVKVAATPGTKSFSITEGDNVAYESGVTIENGQILTGKGKSVSGVVTDSIYFEASFSDDGPPYGTKYIVSGHRRTGFLEDELE
jgi:hypothetical protein